MLLELAHELFFEILGYLEPSDVIHSSRPVCRQLHQISKDRSVWLKILARCDYVLPNFNSSCTSTFDLERFLLHAERVKGVWTGMHPPLRDSPEFSFDLGIEREGYAGLMGNYVVTLQLQATRNAKWSWYPFNSSGPSDGQVPAFTLVPELDPSCQEILTWTSAIAKDSGVFYAGYTLRELLPEGKTCYLKIISVTLHEDQFKSKLEISHVFESQVLFESLSSPLDDRHCPLELSAGYGYVSVHSSLVAPSEPIHVFDIRTGTVIFCPWWRGEDADDISYLLTDLEFTPWHQLIQMRPDEVLDFFQLPSTLGVSDVNEPIHAYKTNSFDLVDLHQQVYIIPRSPTLCMAFVLGGVPGESKFIRLIELDLVTSTPTPKCIYPLSPYADTKIRLSNPFFTNPPNAKSALAVAINQRNLRHIIMGIWIDFNCSTTQGMTLTVVELDSTHEVNIQGQPVRADLDPLSGRIIRCCAGPHEGARHLLAQGYAISSLNVSRKPPHQ